MNATSPTTNEATGVQLVGAERLLELLFPDERDRPTVRWLRMQQQKRLVPFRRIGPRLVRFDPEEVRRAIDKQFTVRELQA